MIPQKCGDSPVKAIKIINRITIIDGVWHIDEHLTSRLKKKNHGLVDLMGLVFYISTF